MGDIQRFRSGCCLASYLDLTPREHSSGRVRRLGGVSKRGNTISACSSFTEPALSSGPQNGVRSILIASESGLYTFKSIEDTTKQPQRWRINLHGLFGSSGPKTQRSMRLQSHNYKRSTWYDKYCHPTSNCCERIKDESALTDARISRELTVAIIGRVSDWLPRARISFGPGMVSP